MERILWSIDNFVKGPLGVLKNSMLISNQYFALYRQPQLPIQRGLEKVLTERHQGGVSLEDVLAFSNSRLLAPARRTDCTLLIGSFAQEYLYRSSVHDDCDIICFVTPHLSFNDFKNGFLAMVSRCDEMQVNQLWKELTSTPAHPLEIAFKLHLIQRTNPQTVFSPQSLLKIFKSPVLEFERSLCIPLKDFKTKALLFGEDEIYQMRFRLGPHRVELSCRQTLPYGFGLNSNQGHALHCTPSMGVQAGISPVIHPIYGTSRNHSPQEMLWMSREQYFSTPAFEHLECALDPQSNNFSKLLMKWLENICANIFPFEPQETLPLLLWQLGRKIVQDRNWQFILSEKLQTTFDLICVWLKTHSHEFEAAMNDYANRASHNSEGEEIAKIARSMVGQHFQRGWQWEFLQETPLTLERLFQAAHSKEMCLREVIAANKRKYLNEVLNSIQRLPSLKTLLKGQSTFMALSIIFHRLREGLTLELVELLEKGNFANNPVFYYEWAPELLKNLAEGISTKELLLLQRLQNYLTRYVGKRPLQALFAVQQQKTDRIEKRQQIARSVQWQENIWNYWVCLLDTPMQERALGQLLHLPIPSRINWKSICRTASRPILRHLVAQLIARCFQKDSRVQFLVRDFLRLAIHWQSEIIEAILQHHLVVLKEAEIGKLLRGIQHLTPCSKTKERWSAMVEWKYEALHSSRGHTEEGRSFCSSAAESHILQPATEWHNKLIKEIWDNKRKGAELSKKLSRMYYQFDAGHLVFKGEENGYLHMLRVMDDIEKLADLLELFQTTDDVKTKEIISVHQATLLVYWGSNTPKIHSSKSIKAFLSFLDHVAPSMISFQRQRELVWCLLYAVHQSRLYSKILYEDAKTLFMKHVNQQIRIEEIEWLINAWQSLEKSHYCDWECIYHILQRHPSCLTPPVYGALLERALTLAQTNGDYLDDETALKELRVCATFLMTEAAAATLPSYDAASIYLDRCRLKRHLRSDERGVIYCEILDYVERVYLKFSFIRFLSTLAVFITSYYLLAKFQKEAFEE